ncbi:MAG TPA: hypothetical protein PK156_23080, partial [Polyangium sp.]|nr:hypothetical protein [Polyangium sp.]
GSAGLSWLASCHDLDPAFGKTSDDRWSTNVCKPHVEKLELGQTLEDRDGFASARQDQRFEIWVEGNGDAMFFA